MKKASKTATVIADIIGKATSHLSIEEQKKRTDKADKRVSDALKGSVFI